MDFAPRDLNGRLHPESLVAGSGRTSGGEFPVPGFPDSGSIAIGSWVGRLAGSVRCLTGLSATEHEQFDC